jgi:hypothetical protein
MEGGLWARGERGADDEALGVFAIGCKDGTMRMRFQRILEG